MADLMQQVAALLGISVPVLRFLIFFLSTVPISWLWRLMPNPTARHLYSAVTGMIISHLAFGPGANALFVFPVVVTYASMVIHRRTCGIVSFVLAFAFLISCHVYYMSGDAWKEGGIDSTGALMVLTLKLISCAMNYQDGLLHVEENLRKSQKHNRLVQRPSVLQYLGYCFCCGSHLAGPVYEMRDYIDWTEGQGLWNFSADDRSPSPYGAAGRTLLKALFCVTMYMLLIPRIRFTKILEPEFRTWRFSARWLFMWLCGFSARWKYYFIWSISEASLIISGLGFSGWSAANEPLWDRAKNVDIKGVELAGSAAELPPKWNIHVSTWLRHYVYERLVPKGKKAGFLQLLATQVVSAVWHGLYAGYILFFVHTALLIAGSRAIYRWQKAIPDKLSFIRPLAWFLNFFYTLLVLNYACIGFLILSLGETIAAYNSVYFAGTLLPIALTIAGNVLKAPRKARRAD